MTARHPVHHQVVMPERSLGSPSCTTSGSLSLVRLALAGQGWCRLSEAHSSGRQASPAARELHPSPMRQNRIASALPQSPHCVGVGSSQLPLLAPLGLLGSWKAMATIATGPLVQCQGLMLGGPGWACTWPALFPAWRLVLGRYPDHSGSFTRGGRLSSCLFATGSFH